MTRSTFPPGWDEARVQDVLGHYESQQEADVVAEDETATESVADTVMVIPTPLVPAVRALIAKHMRDVGGRSR